MKTIRLIIDLRAEQHVNPDDISIEVNKNVVGFEILARTRKGKCGFEKGCILQAIQMPEPPAEKPKPFEKKVKDLPGETWKYLDESPYHMLSSKMRVKVMLRSVPHKNTRRTRTEKIVAAGPKSKKHPDKYARLVWFDQNDVIHSIDLNVNKAMDKYFPKP